MYFVFNRFNRPTTGSATSVLGKYNHRLTSQPISKFRMCRGIMIIIIIITLPQHLSRRYWLYNT